jgi:hypothetical protein
MRNFLRNLVVFSALLSVIAVGLVLVLPGSFISRSLPFLFLFFMGVTYISYSILVKSARNRFLRFVNYYLLLTAAKLVLFILIIVIYILVNKKDAVPFVLSFFILYVCYSIFEVVQIVGYSRNLREN